MAKAVRALKLPIVFTTTERDSMCGPTFPPQLVEELTSSTCSRVCHAADMGVVFSTGSGLLRAALNYCLKVSLRSRQNLATAHKRALGPRS